MLKETKLLIEEIEKENISYEYFFGDEDNEYLTVYDSEKADSDLELMVSVTKAKIRLCSALMMNVPMTYRYHLMECANKLNNTVEMGRFFVDGDCTICASAEIDLEMITKPELWIKIIKKMLVIIEDSYAEFKASIKL